MPKTLFDKIWAAHEVMQFQDGTSMVYIDKHIVHEVTSPQAFEGLANAQRPIKDLGLYATLRPWSLRAFNVLRKIALSLFKQDKSKKISMVRKKKIAAIDDEYSSVPLETGIKML